MKHSGEPRKGRRSAAGYQVAGGATMLAAMVAATVGAGGAGGSALFPLAPIGPAGAPAAAAFDVEQDQQAAPQPPVQTAVADDAGTVSAATAALGTSLAPAGFTDATPDGRARIAVAFALQQLGLPYIWGGNGPANGDAGFDCSGLTTAAYRAAGITLPRTAHTQYYAGPHLPSSAALLPGDLLFYGSPARVTHVGMYIGDGRMVVASTFGTPVRVAKSRWTGDRYLGATRPAAAPGSVYEGFLLTVPPPQVSGPPPAAAPGSDVFEAPPAPITPAQLEAAVAPPAEPVLTEGDPDVVETTTPSVGTTTPSVGTTTPPVGPTTPPVGTATPPAETTTPPRVETTTPPPPTTTSAPPAPEVTTSEAATSSAAAPESAATTEAAPTTDATTAEPPVDGSGS